MSARYIYEYVSSNGELEIAHLDGVAWYDAPVPPRLHRCWPQTIGTINYFDTVERCACGGQKSGRFWLERNTRDDSRGLWPIVQWTRPIEEAPRGAHRATRGGLFRVFRYVDPIIALTVAATLAAIAVIAIFAR